MHNVAKSLLAVVANLLITLVVYGVLRAVIQTRHHVAIDYAVLLLGSTAHFWYMQGVSWRVRVVIAAFSAVLNFYGILAFVTGVLRDGT